MKKILLLSTFLAGGLLLFKPADAQLRIHVNINARPAWGHSDPYWHRSNEVVLIGDRGYRNDRYRDRRDFDNRDWRRDHDRYDDRRHNDRRDDNRYNRDDRNRRQDNDRRQDDDRGEHGRGRW